MPGKPQAQACAGSWRREAAEEQPCGEKLGEPPRAQPGGDNAGQVRRRNRAATHIDTLSTSHDDHINEAKEGE